MTFSSESVAAAFSSMETAINAPPSALSVSDAIFVLWKSAVGFVVLAPDLDVGVPFLLEAFDAATADAASLLAATLLWNA